MSMKAQADIEMLKRKVEDLQRQIEELKRRGRPRKEAA